MPEVKDIEFTIEEIKDIILGLRMSGLTFVEDGAIDEIRMMIKSLPSSENLEKGYNNKDSLKKLLNYIGEIMRFIELYGKRDMEYKARYKSRTGLPPRYKVLDWRAAMKTMKNDDTDKKVDAAITKLSKKINGLQKESGMIGNMFSGAREAYYYKSIGDDIVKFVEEAGKIADKIEPKINKIINPVFRDKLVKVHERLLSLQQMAINARKYMEGIEELSGGAEDTREVAKLGGKVTFSDGQQYTVQKDPASNNLWVNVKGIPYKINVTPDSKVQGFETLSPQQKSRESAGNIWKDYGVEWEKDVDPVLRAIQSLDYNNLNDAALDKLYSIVEKIKTAPATLAKKNSKIITATIYNSFVKMAAPSLAKKWQDAKGSLMVSNPEIAKKFPSYNKVLPLIKDLWEGRLDSPNVNLNTVKDLINGIKEAKKVAANPPATPAPVAPPPQIQSQIQQRQQGQQTPPQSQPQPNQPVTPNPNQPAQQPAPTTSSKKFNLKRYGKKTL